MRSFALAFLFSSSSAFFGQAYSFTDSPALHFRNGVIRPASPSLHSRQPSTQTLQIPIDHSNNGSNTFSNRFWVNSTYYKSGAPVFFMDVGEATASDDLIQSCLMEAYDPSAVMQLARKYNGLAIMMEHRFYGESLPFPIDKITGLAPAGYDAYRYLTIEQALEDVVYLAQHFQPEGLNSSWTKLHPSQTPWVFLGGSYPGNRAAWLRIRNPDIIYASWASSAPVETVVDMSTYYTQVYSDMTANCSADMAAASSYLTDVLTNGSAKDRAIVTVMSNLAQAPSNISQYLGMDDVTIQTAFEGANTTDFGVAYNLANFIGDGLQSFGFTEALLPFCTLVEEFDAAEVSNSSISSIIDTTFNNPFDLRPTPQGIAANHGRQAAFLALMFGIYAQSAAIGNEPSYPDSHAMADANSWTWQTCLDFGYFQVANTSSPNNLLSSFINVTSWHDELCVSNFPYPQLPSSPNAQTIVDKYGGWNMNPSHVMFTDGLKDPWHTLSVQSNSTEIGAPNRTTTQTVPDCGKAANGNDVFGLTYPDAYHASDLSGGTAEFEQGLALFEKALDKWLPCFQKHSVTSNTTSSTTPTSTGSAPGVASTSAVSGAAAMSRHSQLVGMAMLMAVMVIM
ncbi:hypothetical protein AMS68_007960 [Peltaster fructicola]|uniref:Peptidase S28 n=1 Tax=Peltaster fructicola TaxID=286661 RepID=A0A6H0Y616_9PEZI|nr:hypothetical protein AMS68_007960 [Peltaster fructicola]